MSTPTAATEIVTASASASSAAVAATADQISGGRSRVRRACQYCRRKRLKCTADQRPCLNCQLYGAECVQVPEPSGPRRRRTRATVGPVHARHAVNNDGRPIDERSEPPRDLSLLSEDGGQNQDQDQDQDRDQDELSVSNATAASLLHDALPDGPSDLFTSPDAISMSAFESAMHDVSIDLTPDLWSFHTFMATRSPPDEHAAAEQLLALQSPPATETGSLPRSLPRSGGKGRAGRIFGVDALTSQSTTSLGAISPGIFHRKEEGNSLFLGYTSTAAILALCVRGSSAVNPRPADPEPLGAIVDCGPMCDEISVADTGDRPLQQVPSTTLAAQCVNAFFEDYHASYPIADRSDINLILERYVCGSHRALRPFDRSMLYLTTALGASSRPALSKNLSINVDNLYALAWDLFPHAVAVPSLASVQILLLHVLYNIHWSKWSIAWVLSGIAARVAQSVGLHKTTPLDFGLDNAQPRLRVRLWAVTLILDAQLSMSQGRPPACQTSQYDAEVLSTKSSLLHVPELRWPLSQVLTWRVSMARIQQKLNTTFSSVATMEQRLSCLEGVDQDLIRWKEELPPEFQPEQQTILDSNDHIDIYMLHLDYFNLLRSIHWGLINHRPEAGVANHAAPRLRASESICLGACLALVRTLNAMADGDTRARSFRSRSDHFISAMAIVYRDILRNPAKLSARTNLEYLRVMRLHLGRMAGEHLLSASLTKLFENMAISAERLVREHSGESMQG